MHCACLTIDFDPDRVDSGSAGSYYRGVGPGPVAWHASADVGGNPIGFARWWTSSSDSMSLTPGRPARREVHVVESIRARAFRSESTGWSAWAPTTTNAGSTA
jgi:hypothetical protein